MDSIPFSDDSFKFRKLPCKNKAKVAPGILEVLPEGIIKHYNNIRLGVITFNL